MWRLPVSDLPEGYIVLDHEDGVALLGPDGRIVAEFALIRDLEVVRLAAWNHAWPSEKAHESPQIQKVDRLVRVGGVPSGPAVPEDVDPGPAPDPFKN